MAKIPAYDGRLMHLGEAQDLLDYAKEMQDLLELRWKQQKIRVPQRCKEAGYTQEDFEGEYQFEEYQHAKYELYLDGQLVISAWSVLQGAVKHCAAFLAERLEKETKLSSLKLKGKPPAEEIWRQYYEQVLQVAWPLKEGHAAIAKLRELRNDYGHSLFFEPFSVRARLEKFTRSMETEQSELYYRIGEFAALQGQGVPACELTVRLVEKLKDHATAIFPHDGVSFSLWDRKR